MNEHIEKTINFVKEKLEGAEAGHDWFHIERVWKLSKKISEKEGGNLEVIELSALLHDIADPNFTTETKLWLQKFPQNFLKVLKLKKISSTKFFILLKIFRSKIEQNRIKILL
jgi:uncharacterized protein